MNSLLIYLNVHTIFLPIFDWLLMHSRITFIRPRQAGICVSIIWIVIFIHASCLSSKNHGCEKKSQVGQRELVNETLDRKWIFRRLVIIQTSSYRFNQITIVMDDTSREKLAIFKFPKPLFFDILILGKTTNREGSLPFFITLDITLMGRTSKYVLKCSFMSILNRKQLIVW